MKNIKKFESLFDEIPGIDFTIENTQAVLKTIMDTLKDLHGLDNIEVFGMRKLRLLEVTVDNTKTKVDYALTVDMMDDYQFDMELIKRDPHKRTVAECWLHDVKSIDIFVDRFGPIIEYYKNAFAGLERLNGEVSVLREQMREKRIEVDNTVDIMSSMPRTK